MAIKNTSKKPFIEDNDTNISIGLDLPIRKSNDMSGYFAASSTTIEAVKNNIKNLLNTNIGERLLQPTLGLNLRKYLFEQINDETILKIQNEILDLFKIWLPFVEVRNIIVKKTEDDTTVGVNALVLDIIFNIKQDPNTLENVQVSITNTSKQY